MGIFDFFKKNKDKAEVDTNSGSAENDDSQNNTNDKEAKSDILDNMSRQTFYRNEAAYRHQQIVLPRFKADSGIPVGVILEKLFPDVVPQIDNMTVLHTVQMNDVETKHQHFSSAKEALAYDLFWNIFYKNEKDNEIYPISGTNITLTIRTKGENVPPYIVLFVRGMATGFEEVYIRITLMIPANVAEDDLRTSKSYSVPIMTSFLIACDLKDNPKQFEEYEEAEKRVWKHLKTGEPFQERYDLELFYGLGELRPYAHYIDYADYLYDKERYYDAYIQYSRAINYLQRNPLEDMSVYYDTCKKTARCLMHHNQYEMAGYYYSLAYSGGALTDEENEKFWIAIADIRSIDFLCANLTKKHGEDINKWPQEAQGMYNRVFYQYKKNCDEDKERSDKVAFYSDSGIGLILMRLLNIEDSNICGMNIISPDGNISIIDRDQISNESIYKYLIPGTTIVFPYSRAYYATGDKDDKSILCHASSIIMYVDSANETEKLVRVNIMIPNFATDDDKHDDTKTNDPICISFIMSSVDEPKLDGEENLDVIYDYANKCIKHNRFYDAHMAFLFIYKKLSVDRLKLKGEELELFHKAAYSLGFCFEELQIHEKALFYLELANFSRIDTHEQEYINALVNNRDPRALNIIREAKSKNYEASPDSEEYRSRNAFLKRREAYVLIDQEKYDEAEMLLKEMLNDPMSKEFAEGELKYVEQMKRQSN